MAKKKEIKKPAVIKKVVKPVSKKVSAKKTVTKVVKKVPVEKETPIEKEIKTREYPSIEAVKKDLESGALKEGEPWEITEPVKEEEPVINEVVEVKEEVVEETVPEIIETKEVVETVTELTAEQKHDLEREEWIKKNG